MIITVSKNAKVIEVLTASAQVGAWAVEGILASYERRGYKLNDPGIHEPWRLTHADKRKAVITVDTEYDYDELTKWLHI